jgi:hypothetical protein
VQNNRTMMLASVSQGISSHGRKGLPILGGLPFLGRLFTSPTRDDRRVDIVISVTPRVLRAPAITPRDEEMRPSGTYTSPTTGLLAEMIQEADREEQIAARRMLPKDPVIEPAAFVPAPRSLISDRAASEVATVIPGNSSTHNAVLSSLQTTVDTPLNSKSAPPSNVAEISFLPEDDVLRVGDKRRYSIQINSDVALGRGWFAIRFDPKVVKVTTITADGQLGTERATLSLIQSIDPNGVCLISISGLNGKTPIWGTGPLFFIDVEAVGPGIASLSFDREALQLFTVDGSSLRTTTSNWRGLVH